MTDIIAAADSKWEVNRTAEVSVRRSKRSSTAQTFGCTPKALAIRQADKWSEKTDVTHEDWAGQYPWHKVCPVSGREINYWNLGDEDRPVLLRKDMSKPWKRGNLEVISNWAFKRGLHNPAIASVVKALQEANK